MAHFIKLLTHADQRGYLTVIENIIPFEIKRVYYIYNSNNKVRGGHRHKKTIQAAVCVSGSCRITCQSGKDKKFINFDLSSPDKLLIIEPEDYHTMAEFTDDCILLVLASENYNINDYIDEKY